MISIGIDVSKEKLDVLWLKDTVNRKVKTKVLGNTLKAHNELMNWVLKNTGAALDELHFVMEATGVYHNALAQFLFEQGAHVFVENPSRIKAHAQSLGVRGKTDKKDSFVIAHYGATMTLRPWQPEPADIQVLKALIARHQAVEKDLQRELNRLEKAVISPSSQVVSDSIHEMLDALKQQRAKLLAEIDRHINSHPDLKNDRALLESIPGVGPVISSLMLSVIGSRDFKRATQCSAFIGLNPVPYESGSSVHRPAHLSKMGDGRIRAKLYMAAVSAIHCNPDIKCQYERLLKNGKSKMAALGAAMRKLVQICFGVLKHQTRYQPQVC